MIFKQYFPISYPSDVDDLSMTCSDFVNALKTLICSDKHPVSRANHGNAKKMLIITLHLQKSIVYICTTVHVCIRMYVCVYRCICR